MISFNACGVGALDEVNKYCERLVEAISYFFCKNN